MASRPLSRWNLAFVAIGALFLGGANAAFANLRGGSAGENGAAATPIVASTAGTVASFGSTRTRAATAHGVVAATAHGVVAATVDEPFQYALPKGFENTREWYLKHSDVLPTVYAPAAPARAGTPSASDGPSLRLHALLLQHPARPDAFHMQRAGGLVQNVRPSALVRGAVSRRNATLSFKAADAKAETVIGARGAGTLKVLVSSDFLDAAFGFEGETGGPQPHGEPHGDHHHHHHDYDSVAVPGHLTVGAATIVKSYRKQDGYPGAVFALREASLILAPTKAQRGAGVLPLAVAFRVVELVTELAPAPFVGFPVLTFPEWWPWPLRVKRRICVQPVRVAQRRCRLRVFGLCFLPYYASVSGRGLAFGQPGADDEWGKVDIAFDWQPWKTVVDTTGVYQSITSGQEEADLKNEVTDDDCIEVFFAESFTPSDMNGGGACWGGGTAGAQIITSDENADCGIDRTHLAHELGHVLDLKHPGSNHATRPDGTPGTLMCGSGWERDNPRRQSEENGDNAGNPLLTSYIAWFSAGGAADCTDSSDCGTCAAHTPNEPCV